MKKSDIKNLTYEEYNSPMWIKRISDAEEIMSEIFDEMKVEDKLGMFEKYGMEIELEGEKV